MSRSDEKSGRQSTGVGQVMEENRTPSAESSSPARPSASESSNGTGRMTEQDVAARQVELDRLAKMLASRLQEIHERERDLEERASGNDSAAPRATSDSDAARRQVEEYQKALAGLQAEYDSKATALTALQDRYGQIERVNSELETTLEQMRKVRENEPDDWPMAVLDQTLATNDSEEVQRLRNAVSDLEERLKKSTAQYEKLVTAPKHEGSADAKHFAIKEGETSILLRQVAQDRWQLAEEAQKLHHERAEFQKHAESVRLDLGRELGRIEQANTDLAAQRRQVLEERHKLAEQMRELHAQREEAQRVGTAGEEVERERQRLEGISAGLAEFGRQIEDDRRRLEEIERTVKLRENEIDIRDAEIREMKELAEQKLANDRAELAQERLRLVRERSRSGNHDR